MSAPNRVDVLTDNKIVKGVADSVLGGNPMALKFLLNAKPWKQGKTWDKPVKTSQNSNTGSFRGLDTLSNTSVDNIQKFSYDPAFFYGSVTLAGTDVALNKRGGGTVEDLVDIHVDSLMEDMAEEIGEDFYLDGTGNSNKDFLGLAAIVDDGNSVASIGGLSRSTYSTLQSTVTASGGAMTLAKLATLHSNASRGNKKPDYHSVTETIFDLYEQLQTPQARQAMEVSMRQKGLTLGSGATAQFYRGKPVIADENCTSGVWFMLNTSVIDFFALPLDVMGAKPINLMGKLEDTVYSEVKGLGFHTTGFIGAQSQWGATKYVLLGGQLLTWNPNLHAKLTGINTV